MKLFLDTNVLLDLYEQRHPFYEDVKKLQIMEAMGDAELWCSAKSFTDMFHIMKPRYDSEAIQRAFENSFEFLHICGIDGSDVKGAIDLKRKDFEDCVIDIAAQKTKADYLLTRDASDFGKAKTKVMSPHAFLTHMKEDYGLTYEEMDWWE